MRGLAFHAPGDVRLESVPDARLEAPTDALVRVELSAICGSDLHVYRGHEVGLDQGTLMGHEFLGRVEAVGDEVGGLSPGDRVIAPFSISCGACFYCERDLPSRCLESQLFGWVQEGRGLHGGQAELVRVPLASSSLVALPAGLSEEAALLAGDVLSTGFHAAAQAGVQQGDLVCVLGCGPVGLCAVLGARELGAREVLAVDTLPERLELARSFGATPVELAGDEPGRSVRAATDGRGADAVIEAVWHPAASRLAWELVRCGGTLSVPGVHNEANFAFPPGAVYDKNLTYRSGRAPVRAWMDRTLAWLGRTEVDLAALISHRMPLSEGAHGYRIFEGKLEGCTKVLLRP
jgi:threonine dehydrogenase-like Zn-dependent dehydrogenase